MKQHTSDILENFKKYLEFQKLSKLTIKYYLSDVRVFVRFVYQISGQHTISPEMFESYENFLKSGSLPNKTVNRKLSSLRILNTYLLKEGILKENFMSKVKNNKGNPTPFRMPSNIVLFIVFLIIVLVGGGLLATNSKDIFSPISQSISPTTVAISKTFTQNTPYLNTSQNLSDIVVEGTTVEKQTKTIYGSDSIPVGSESHHVDTTTEFGEGVVLITPTSPVDGNYYVRTDKNGFTVYLQKAQTSDFTFNWIEIFSQLPVDKLPR